RPVRGVVLRRAGAVDGDRVARCRMGRPPRLGPRRAHGRRRGRQPHGLGRPVAGAVRGARPRAVRPGENGDVTLRFRLVVGLVVLTTIGLAVFGVATYALYAHDQYDRLDDQLRASVPI